MIQLTEQAMPGDQVKWNCPKHGVCWATVKSVLSLPGANGGKVFVYEAEDGEQIPFDSVIEVFHLARDKFLKSLPKDDEVGTEDAKAYLKIFVEGLNLPCDLKTAVMCIVENDEENLKIALYILQRRFPNLKLSP